ncbi:MerR family transcriptional regulator [Pseudoalteromonas sp. SG45-5]|uniref:MerR family transcriptional regulator n=1 Tax=unclassified Pseudoalteromonas TaxID=194690 RepID=UPI0015FA8FD2|nr:MULTISPECIES: MerR family transcriptional regulator [unclassified Pseudoalteromonas]MBB1385351.1 MerR family transcriptional regulator [Pseudoalteromonas sp. SG45-5]MBB1393277.1 MerR family transcriptional regulator [Pseudoalteromonas sp. SG44-4]MBB1447802.1 MerR family transcriptional regulator [Pseudoalteromonas sp. SG41-6]
MQIKQLSQLVNLNEKTIRYYEQIGLTPPAQRANNGYRVYLQDDVERLVFIRRCRDLQIPIDDIKVIIAAQNQGDESCIEVDGIIEKQLIKVRAAQKELKKLERSLSNLLDGCSEHSINNCNIIKKLKS